jgi:ADP-heptose:LPS heptosyltransferase
VALSIDTMRWVDRFLGIPLCWIATGWVFLSDFFSRRKVQTRRVLFIELSEMGSVILADPAIQFAKSKDADVFFLIFSKNRGSLNLLETIPAQNIMTIDESSFLSLIKGTFQVLWKIRKLKIDAIIDLELFSRYTALLSGLSDAKIRVGFFNFFREGLWRGNMLTHKILYNPHQHIAKNFLALTHSLFSTKQELPFLKKAIADEEIDLSPIDVSNLHP